MKHNINRITINVSLCILLMIVVITYIVINIRRDHNNIDERKSESRIENLGSIVFGVYDENGIIIDSGNTIHENNIFHTISLGQNLSNSREYLLIVFVDYKQINFKCEGEIINYKKIKLSEKEVKYIDIEFEVDENSKDLSYLFIKEPDYKFNIDNLDKAHSLQEVMTLRYNLSNVDKNIDIMSQIETNDDKPIPDIFLSMNPIDLKILYRIEYDKEFFLSVGNISSDDNVTYAIIKLANWEQTPIGEDIVKYITLNAKEKTFFTDNNYNIGNDSNVQYLCFPYPYKIERSNFKSRIANGTFRVLVTNTNK